MKSAVRLSVSHNVLTWNFWATGMDMPVQPEFPMLTSDKLRLWYRERWGVLRTDGLAGIMWSHDSHTIHAWLLDWTGWLRLLLYRWLMILTRLTDTRIMLTVYYTMTEHDWWTDKPTYKSVIRLLVIPDSNLYIYDFVRIVEPEARLCFAIAALCILLSTARPLSTLPSTFQRSLKADLCLWSLVIGLYQSTHISGVWTRAPAPFGPHTFLNRQVCTKPCCGLNNQCHYKPSKLFSYLGN
jgi:hypothetical protein